MQYRCLNKIKLVTKIVSKAVNKWLVWFLEIGQNYLRWVAPTIAQKACWGDMSPSCRINHNLIHKLIHKLWIITRLVRVMNHNLWFITRTNLKSSQWVKIDSERTCLLNKLFWFIIDPPLYACRQLFSRNRYLILADFKQSHYKCYNHSLDAKSLKIHMHLDL